MWKVMWKDGLISESDALYHWATARDVLKTDNNVVRKKDDEK